MDFRKLLKTALRLVGWSAERRNNNHLKLVAPDGDFHWVSATPSDWRASRNLRAWLRRKGVPV